MKKTALKIVFCFILIAILVSSFNVYVGKTEPTLIYVDDDNLTGPWDGTQDYPYQNITSALMHASNGSTVFVCNGTYYERLVIDKPVNLIGQNRHGTIIDGNRAGNVIQVTADNVSIVEFTIKNSGFWNYKFSGISLEKVSNVNVKFNIIKYNYKGIHVLNSSNNILTGNDISNNLEGAYWVNSNRNLLTQNKFSNNEFGIVLSSSGNSTLFHNNFINNTNTVSNSVDSANSWDNGKEGNYWSKHKVSDVDQNGIGDQPRTIDANNRDNYPLMGLFYDFIVVHQSEKYHVPTISNSSISNLEFNETIKMLSFNVTDLNGAVYFSRIVISHLLLNWPYVVLDDNEEINATVLSASNATHTSLYFTYIHPTIKIFTKPYYELLERYDKLSANYLLLNSTLSQLLDDYDLLNQTYRSVLENYTQLQADYNKLNETYVNLNEMFHELEANHTQLKVDFDLLNDTYEQLLANFESLNQTNIELAANYTQLLANYYALNETHQLTSENYTQLQADYNKLNETYQKVLGDYVELQDDFNLLNLTYRDLKFNYTALQGEYNFLLSSYDELVVQFDLLNESYEELSANDTKLHEDFDYLQEAYNVLLEENNLLNSTHSQTKLQYAEARVTLSYISAAAVAVIILLSSLGLRYYLAARKQRNLIEDYKRLLEQASYLDNARVLFKRDVERRGSKIDKFEQKYGISVRPHTTLKDALQSLELKKEKD